MKNVINEIVRQFTKEVESKWKNGEAIEWYYDPLEHENKLRGILKEQLSSLDCQISGFVCSENGNQMPEPQCPKCKLTPPTSDEVLQDNK